MKNKKKVVIISIILIFIITINVHGEGYYNSGNLFEDSVLMAFNPVGTHKIRKERFVEEMKNGYLTEKEFKEYENEEKKCIEKFGGEEKWYNKTNLLPFWDTLPECYAEVDGKYQKITTDRRIAEEKRKEKLKEGLKMMQEQGLGSNFLIDSLAPMKLPGSEKAKYNQYPLSHYALDLLTANHASLWNAIVKDQGGTEFVAGILHIFINCLWFISILMCRVALWLYEAAASTDIFSEFNRFLEETVKSLAGIEGNVLTNDGIWGIALPIMIVVLGVWVGWKSMIQDNADAAQRGFLVAILIVIGSFVYFQNASAITSKANDITIALSQKVLEIGLQIPENEDLTKGGKSATVEDCPPDCTPKKGPQMDKENPYVTAGEYFWNITVLQPFKLMEFGTTIVKEEERLSILAYSPESTERTDKLIDEVSKYRNSNISTASTVSRLMFVPLVFFINILACLIISAISMLLIAYQMFFILLIIISPVALIWGIVPTWRKFAASWVIEMLSALLYRIALSLILGIYLSVSFLLYVFSERLGNNYLLTALLQVAWVLIFIYKRKTILHYCVDPIYALIGGRSTPGGSLGGAPGIAGRMTSFISRVPRKSSNIASKTGSVTKGAAKKGSMAYTKASGITKKGHQRYLQWKNSSNTASSTGTDGGKPKRKLVRGSFSNDGQAKNRQVQVIRGKSSKTIIRSTNDSDDGNDSTTPLSGSGGPSGPNFGSRSGSDDS